MVKLELIPDIYWRLDKATNKSSLTSTGVSMIKNKLYSEPEFSEWITKVAGDQEQQEQQQEQVLQEYYRVATSMIDKFLEQTNNKEDNSHGTEALRKAIEGQKGYEEVSIGVHFPAPTAEGPVFKTYSLRPIEHFSLDSQGKAVITEQGENYLHDQFYGNTQGRSYMQKLANKDEFMEDIVKGVRDAIENTLENNQDYKEVLDDWINERMKDHYKKFIPNIVFTIPLRTID